VEVTSNENPSLKEEFYSQYQMIEGEMREFGSQIASSKIYQEMSSQMR
jgi:hypothetical protein